MIKVGKIQVNENISPKVYLIFIFFSLGLLMFVGCSGLSIFLKTKDYVKVNSKITKVDYRIIYKNGNDYTTINYVMLEYEYNGNKYENEQRISFKFNKKVGNKVKIYIDPSHPKKVRDNYIFRLNIFFSIVLLIMHILLIKFYWIRVNLKKIK